MFARYTGVSLILFWFLYTYLLKAFLVLFTLITVLISLKTVVHRVEGASLRAVLLGIAWWLEMYSFTTDDGQHVGRNAFCL
jgi:hypothetical protein